MEKKQYNALSELNEKLQKVWQVGGNIDKNEEMRIIAKTIVAFAKELGIKTVAEYVHSKEILDCVKEIGIDYAQGFYIGKPSVELL